MKAAIFHDGNLRITAESELESFALRNWYNRYKSRKECRLDIVTPDEFLDHSIITGWLTQVGRHLPEYRKWLLEHKPEVARGLGITKDSFIRIEK